MSASDRSSFYLVHVSDNCPWCVRAKALLDHYKISYAVTTEPCSEWPTWPAIYKIDSHGKELIGGYSELCELPFED